MVDDSNADDDGFLYDHEDDDDEPPFDIDDLVALDPVYLDEDDPDAEIEGYVVEIRPEGRGWRVLVEWPEGNQQWWPSNRLILA